LGKIVVFEGYCGGLKKDCPAIFALNLLGFRGESFSSDYCWSKPEGFSIEEDIEVMIA